MSNEYKEIKLNEMRSWWEGYAVWQDISAHKWGDQQTGLSGSMVIMHPEHDKHTVNLWFNTDTNRDHKEKVEQLRQLAHMIEMLAHDFEQAGSYIKEPVDEEIANA